MLRHIRDELSGRVGEMRGNEARLEWRALLVKILTIPPCINPRHFELIAGMCSSVLLVRNSGAFACKKLDAEIPRNICIKNYNIKDHKNFS